MFLLELELSGVALLRQFRRLLQIKKIITNAHCASSVHSACVGIGNTLVAFKTNSKLFFQMSAQVYSVSGQRRKDFLEWTSIDLCGGNVNYYKSVHHPILTLPVEIGNTLTIFKTNQ